MAEKCPNGPQSAHNEKLLSAENELALFDVLLREFLVICIIKVFPLHI